MTGSASDRLRWVADGLTEEVTVRSEGGGWTVDATVEGHRGRVTQYVLRCTFEWQVVQLLVFNDGDGPAVWLRTDGAGRWADMVARTRRDDLQGAHDVELAWSSVGDWIRRQRRQHPDEPAPPANPPTAPPRASVRVDDQLRVTRA